MNVVWAYAALDDMEETRRWIARDAPSVAQTVAVRVLDAVDLLVEHPQLGRVGRVEGTRELAVSKTPFVIFYRVEADSLEILRVLRGARSTLPQL